MKKSLRVNIIYQMIYEILVLLVPLITSPYISRVLGAEGIGMYSFAYNIAFYFGLFCMLGVKNYGSREIAKCKTSKKELSEKFWNIYILQFGISIITIVIYYICINLWFYDYKYLLLINILHILACMIDITWFYNGLEEFKITVTRNMVIKLFSLFCVLVFVKLKTDLWKYCLIVVGSNFLSQLILWFQLKKYVNKIEVDIKNAIKHIKPMLVLFIPVISVSLYNVMDKIMLGILSNNIQLGFYENSEKIIFCIKTIITSFGVVMLPRMSKLQAEKNKIKSNQYIETSMIGVMLIANALAFGIASVSNQFVDIYWGEDFFECGILLRVLCITLPFSSFANVIRTQYLLPNNMDKEYMYSVLYGAIINLILNVYLIPKIMALGAVIATVITEITVCVYQCWVTRKRINIKGFFKKTYCFCLYGLIMCICVTLLNNILIENVLVFLFKIIIGAVVYCMLCLIHLINVERELLQKIIPPKYNKKIIKVYEGDK